MSMSKAQILPAVVACFVALSAPEAQQTPGQSTPAARPRRTEADARAAADRNRQEREKQRKLTGAPLELLADYVKANIGPVPDSLGVSPFYKKYADALGIPVLASEKVP